MYIRITSKCNMKCGHCGFSCRPGAGQHMEMDTFLHALSIAEDYCGFVTLGGGEPTMHPEFFDILMHTQKSYWGGILEAMPFMVTNGKNYSRAQKLIERISETDYGNFRLWEWEDEEYDNYYENPGIRVELSTDYYHEPIDPRILGFYKTKQRLKCEYAGTRDVTQSYRGVIGAGRAKRTGNYQTDNDCLCDDWVVQPNGDVYTCGCLKVKVGTIWDRDILSQDRQCYKETKE